MSPPLLALDPADPISHDDVILTGDRPTGRLHAGHAAGTVFNRVVLQDHCKQTILIADLQALTDHFDDPAMVRANVLELILDYLSCGIDPAKSTICLQSAIPELSELTVLLMNLVSVSRLERNPTVRSEIASRGFVSVPTGFLVYPISQAADLIGFATTRTPVGSDQLPVIEVSNEIVRKLNRMAGRPLFSEHRAIISKSHRLPGIDGQSKASKSAGNAIYLSDGPDIVRAKVMAMYTDPNHIRAQDPGTVDGNVVFAYLNAFDPAPQEIAQLEADYTIGGVGDMLLKRRLVDVLNARLDPIRAERRRLMQDVGYLRQILHSGSQIGRVDVRSNLEKVRGLFNLGDIVSG